MSSVSCMMFLPIQSHSFHEAHWNGQCSLSEEQKMAQVLQRHVQPDYNELTDAMQDLGT